jgi:hypothetical protein
MIVEAQFDPVIKQPMLGAARAARDPEDDRL